MSIHSDQRLYCRITYWRMRDGVRVACGPDDEWDVCTVGPASSYSSYGEQDFSRDKAYKMHALVSLLSSAFDAGRHAKLREIKSMLEIR
jgi:hypothetical protein